MNYNTLRKFKTVNEKINDIILNIVLGIVIILSLSIIVFFISFLLSKNILFSLYVVFSSFFVFTGFYFYYIFPFRSRKCPYCNCKMKFFNDNEHNFVYFCENCKVKIESKFKTSNFNSGSDGI